MHDLYSLSSCWHSQKKKKKAVVGGKHGGETLTI